MSEISGTTSKRRRAGLVTAAVILTSTLIFGGVAGPASADEHDWNHRHHDNRHYNYDRGYYRAPPVVYGTPYYAPPVVYGPGWGGLNIQIR